MSQPNTNEQKPLSDLMNDPHIVALRYKMIAEPGVRFENPPPIDHEAPSFRLKLENGWLTAEMKDHFGTIEDARKQVDDFLAAWELSASIDQNRKIFAFEYAHADIVDRQPSPEKQKAIRRLQTTFTFSFIADESELAVFAHLPPPPANYSHVEEVNAMWNRYQKSIEGEEPIASMAYFCLSLMENKAGGRSNAATMFGIEKDVLNKLGQLTSAVGDLKTARKGSATSSLRAHTPTEIDWMKNAVRECIRRMGNLHPLSVPAPHPLSMKELPPLS